MNSIKDYYEILATTYPGESLMWDEPMSRHTSFKIGGPADLFFLPETVEDLRSMVAFCKDKDVDFYIMGNGSNLLVGDGGYRGVVIQVYRNLNRCTIEGATVKAEAGILLSRLANRILEKELAGFEFASGIPGTLGGAVYMNAGAYGGEIKDVLVSATVMDMDGNVRTIDVGDLDLGYRHSSLMARHEIVLSAELSLETGDATAIRAQMDELNQRRKDKQPIEKPSAGSTFKRPTGYYAGKLIMDAGLRGHQIGGAQVSDKHCGFVINAGGATGRDVLALINYIQAEVKKQFGVDLEPEVRMIGEF